ncbi:hypothetical protein HBI88_096370 [Parastagonospora nodorum]|nr:hypothetical protein HBI97_203790 [Parastagonospora nodorum]KAH5794768.1 hypothetical protein HBI94_252530 [Parastagonospora nodorum]KAH5807415.1 hypothetical protein HBI96_108100 [Parastagonospora nodorum]KAH5809143.1 hypothetical protein HBI93_234610 [Parastagonospora nodorum]KAH5844590.1 hypothetical protein HBI91_240410 [Parastagonospora nodorum]
MCAKDDLIRRKGPLLTSTQTWEVLFQTHDRRLAEELATAESVTAKEYNILSLIAFIISHRLFADELVYALSQFFLGNTDYPVRLVYVTIGNLSREAQRQRSTPSTLLARFIPTTKIRDPLLKKRCLDKGHDDFVHLVNCFRWKHYNFNIYVSLATDTLHLLLKGLVMKMLDFMQDILDDIYPSKQKVIIQQLIAIVSPLFVSKAPFALHFIRAVCDLHALTYIIQDIRMYRALNSICTRANSEAHHITIRTALLAADYATIVKQSQPSTTVDIQDRTYSTRVTRPLPFRRLRWSILGIQPYSTKLPLSEVAANIAISDFTHAAARRDYVWVQEFKHRDNRRQSRTVTDGRVVAQLHLILTIIDYTRYDKDRKHIAYIRAFSKVLLFNNNRQIDNTTRMLSMPFKFYDLSTIIRLVHLVLRDLPNLTTRTTMSYYVNNYIN